MLQCLVVCCVRLNMYCWNGTVVKNWFANLEVWSFGMLNTRPGLFGLRFCDWGQANNYWLMFYSDPDLKKLRIYRNDVFCPSICLAILLRWMGCKNCYGSGVAGVLVTLIDSSSLYSDDLYMYDLYWLTVESVLSSQSMNRVQSLEDRWFLMTGQFSIFGENTRL